MAIRLKLIALTMRPEGSPPDGDLSGECYYFHGVRPAPQAGFYALSED